MNYSGTWRDVLRFAKRFWWPERVRWAVVIGLTALAMLSQLPIPILTMYMIDRAVPHRDMHLLLLVGISSLALYTLRSCCLYLSEKMTLVTKEKTTLKIQSTLLEHVLFLPMGFHGDNHSGYLQSRIMGDARSLDAGLIKAIASTTFDALTVLAVLLLIIRIRLDLALIMSACIVPFIIVRSVTHRHLVNRSVSLQEEQGRASLVVYESLAAIRTIKSSGTEGYQRRIADKALQRLCEEYIRTNSIHVNSSSATNFITSGGIAVILLWGCLQVIKGHATIGETIAITSYLGILFAPISNIASFHLSSSGSIAAIHRINAYLNLPRENSGELPIKEFQHQVVFRDVTFSYHERQPLLQEVGFEIPARSITAIVGATGAGKSTLINLLLRFYDPVAGEILLDGFDIKTLRSSDIRALIGLVDQQTYIFNGTIYENLVHGCELVTEDSVRRASEMAYAADFIAALPAGYETLVGERGTKLSTGQRQRLALARIFLRDQQIVVLDEAVSGVDAESESYIQAALLELARSKTVIVIAHRLSSLMMAENVVVLDSGKVVATGTHASLLTDSEAYRVLFREQFKPQQLQPCANEEIEYA